MMGHAWGMGMGLTWLVWLLILLVLVALVVALVLRSSGQRGRSDGRPVPPPAQPPDGSGGRSEAQRILDERYARGEIDDEEYQARRRRLGEPDT